MLFIFLGQGILSPYSILANPLRKGTCSLSLWGMLLTLSTRPLDHTLKWGTEAFHSVLGVDSEGFSGDDFEPKPNKSERVQ